MSILKIPGYFLAFVRFLLMLLLIALHVGPYMFFSSFAFKHNSKSAFKLRRSFMSFTLPILGIKIEKQGKVHDAPALYVCNHRSLSDPMALTYFLDAFVIAKAEVGDIPLLNKGALITGIIYVKRESIDSRKATRKAMVDTVLSGENVLVYPEGTTNANFHTLPYRPGTFVEAAKHGIPIVPVTLEYKSENDLWIDRGLIEHWFYQFWKVRTDCKLIIGKAMCSDDFEELRLKSESWTNKKIEEIHSNWEGSYFSKQEEHAN